MAFDATFLAKLKNSALAFKDAADRGADKAATVRLLAKFLEDILGYDSSDGELSEGLVIKEKNCDFALVVDGDMKFLVEVEAAGPKKGLQTKDLESVESCAVYSGVRWVILTNGCHWHVYHLRADEGEGSTRDLALELEMNDFLKGDPQKAWAGFRLLSNEAVLNGELDAFWNKKKAISPSVLIPLLLSEPILHAICRELNQNAEVGLEMTDVYAAVKSVIRTDAIVDTRDQ